MDTWEMSKEQLKRMAERQLPGSRALRVESIISGLRAEVVVEFGGGERIVTVRP